MSKIKLLNLRSENMIMNLWGRREGGEGLRRPKDGGGGGGGIAAAAPNLFDPAADLRRTLIGGREDSDSWSSSGAGRLSARESLVLFLRPHWSKTSPLLSFWVFGTETGDLSGSGSRGSCWCWWSWLALKGLGSKARPPPLLLTRSSSLQAFSKGFLPMLSGMHSVLTVWYLRTQKRLKSEQKIRRSKAQIWLKKNIQSFQSSIKKKILVLLWKTKG